VKSSRGWHEYQLGAQGHFSENSEKELFDTTIRLCYDCGLCYGAGRNSRLKSNTDIQNSGGQCYSGGLGHLYHARKTPGTIGF